MCVCARESHLRRCFSVSLSSLSFIFFNVVLLFSSTIILLLLFVSIFLPSLSPFPLSLLPLPLPLSFLPYSDIDGDSISSITGIGGGASVSRSRRNPQQSIRLPMTPSQAIKEYGHKLTGYEKKEILEYPDVWFLGLESKKIEGVPGGSQNCGYDDENGSYIKVLHDHISYRYEIREIIGKGSFGQVVKVKNVVCVCVWSLLYLYLVISCCSLSLSLLSSMGAFFISLSTCVHLLQSLPVIVYIRENEGGREGVGQGLLSCAIFSFLI